jgi:hypothetical protein
MRYLFKVVGIAPGEIIQLTSSGIYSGWKRLSRLYEIPVAFKDAPLRILRLDSFAR